MDKSLIMDTYAIEQGYNDFNHLILDDMFEGDFNNIMKTINAVTDLIQEELKKKIAENVRVKIRCEYSANSIEDTYYVDKGESNVIEVSRLSILNTEIL